MASRLAQGAKDGGAVETRRAVCALHGGAEAGGGRSLPDARAVGEPHVTLIRIDALGLGVSEHPAAGRPGNARDPAPR